MYKEENVYSIVVDAKKKEEKGAIYKSQYPHNIAPTASTFGLRNSSFPNVANMSGEYTLPRGAHPLERNYATIGRADGLNKIDPLNYHKKGNTYKILPPLEKLHTSTEIRKPPIPKEPPIMGLKTDKNYIVANIVDNILMEPKKLQTESNEIFRHRSYGRVPKYIKNYRLKVEQEYQAFKEIQRQKKEEEDKKTRLLTEEEVGALREGLRKKWEMYNFRYGKMTHKKAFDNLVLLRK